jgi:hypothetical protein
MREPYGSLSTLIYHCITGWSERVEFSKLVEVNGVTVIEQRASNVRQLPLVTQLRNARFAKRVTAKAGGSSPGKSHKKPPAPGNLEEPDEILYRLAVVARDAVCQVTNLDPRNPRADDASAWLCQLDYHSDKFNRSQLADVTHKLGRVVRSARIHLGYESDEIQFADTVCGDCGGALSAERIAPTEVRCAGSPLAPPCGKTYGWESWSELLAAGPVLVDTKTAERCLGRKPGTLYRWASTGKVTRYGGRKQGEARWDLDELKSYQETLDKRRKKSEDTS